MEEENKEVEKKEETNNIKNGKGTNFLALVFFTIIVVIVASLILAKAFSKKYNGKRVSLNDFENVEIRTITEKQKENNELDLSATDEVDDDNKLLDAQIDSSVKKIEDDKPYVYTVKKENTNEGRFSKYYYYPVVNIDSEEIKEVNNEIEKIYKDIESGKIQAQVMYYNSVFKNGIIDLQVWHGYDDYSERISYHIDTDSQKIISNKDFLDKLGIDSKKLQTIINYEFYNDYNTAPAFITEDIMSIDDFISNTILVNKDGKSEKYTFNLDKICNTCDMYLTSDSTMYIYGLVTPKTYESCEINDGLAVRITGEPVILKDKYEYKVYFGETNTTACNYLPYITFETEDAEKINKELSEFYEKAKKQTELNGGSIYLKAIETDELEKIGGSEYFLTDEIIVNEKGEQVIDNYYSIDYVSEIIKGKVFSILVEETNSKHTNLDHGLWDYSVYNFDMETGKLLSNTEMLEKCGFSIDSIKKEIEKKLGKQSVDIDSLSITFDKLYNYDKRGPLEYNNEITLDVFDKNQPDYQFSGNWIQIYL